MSRRSIYLQADFESDSVDERIGAIEQLDAARRLLEYVRDPDIEPLNDALERGYSDDDQILAPGDAMEVARILRRLPDKLVTSGIVDSTYMLDDAGVARLRGEPIGELLDLEPHRGSSARAAMQELVGTIVGLAQFLERAVAAKLLIALG